MKIELSISGEELRKKLGITADNLRSLIKPLIPAPIKGVDGKPPTDTKLKQLIKPLIPSPLKGSPDTGKEIITKVNDDKSKLVIKKEKVEGLADLENLAKTADANSQNAMRLRAGVLYLSQLLDVSVQGISAGQAIKWTGTQWIPFTPSGANSSAYGEVPTNTGDDINFTLANTPVAGTVRLYRGGAYQSVTEGDYSIVGGTITLTTALETGNTLITDYEY